MTTNSNNIFYLIEVFLISILLQYHGIDYFVVLLLFRPLCLGFGDEGFGDEGLGDEGLGNGDLDDDCCFCFCNSCNSC